MVWQWNVGNVAPGRTLSHDLIGWKPGRSEPDGVSLTGVAELEKWLYLFPARLQKRVLTKAVRFAGRALRKDMRDNIPFGRFHAVLYHSGKLSKRWTLGNTATAMKAAIKTALRVYPSGNVVLVVGPEKGLVSPSRPNKPQRLDKIAIGIERGWRNRVPKPWMHQAYERAKSSGSAIRDFRASIGMSVDKEAVRLFREITGSGVITVMAGGRQAFSTESIDVGAEI